MAGVAALLQPRPLVAVACTVLPDGLRAVAAVLAEHEVPLLIAGQDLACPLELRYPDPSTLGPDRWVAAWAAHRQFGACVVVDCGTALTVDVVTEAGAFLGGAIAPGAGTSARGLSAAVPSLPAPDPSRALAGVPVTSTDAVGAGVSWGFCGAVERLVQEIERAGDVRGATRVLTGGEAEDYLRHGRLEFEHVPDLVHRGLAALWEAREE